MLTKVKSVDKSKNSFVSQIINKLPYIEVIEIQDNDLIYNPSDLVSTILGDVDYNLENEYNNILNNENNYTGTGNQNLHEEDVFSNECENLQMENNDDTVHFENEVGNSDAEIVNVNNDNCNLNDLSKKQKKSKPTLKQHDLRRRNVYSEVVENKKTKI